MSTVIKSIINRYRFILGMKNEDVFVEVNMDDSNFTVTFKDGETISLSKLSLKNEWDILREEIKSANHKSNPEGGDVISKGAQDPTVNSLTVLSQGVFDNTTNQNKTIPIDSFEEAKILSDLQNLIDECPDKPDVSPDATKGSGLHDNEEILTISTEIVSALENKLGTIDNQNSSIPKVDDQTDDKDKNNSTTEMTKNTNESIDKIELTTVTSNNNNDSNDNLNFSIESKKKKLTVFIRR
ncbi:uncharacterized protein LOC122504983 [Leptopilina heterotoma]|uniref:uncharacterized protein LOC122504983 n=1 Tax=Leptopilina heterotoma TaxID=63436 RepID=UPI001CA7C3EB|nr:uncharacterized protein LOC122504983 [Leptopilina heterotoma]